MKIIGCDFHPSFQQIAVVDKETGEYTAHGINANQVFGWRKLYLAGRLGGASRTIKLLPVHVSESSPSLATRTSRECSPSADFAKCTPGTIHIELRHAQVRTDAIA